MALLGDNEYPYAVPISYVYDNSKVYFHGAKTGHKIDAMRKCSKASFCVISQDEVVPEEYTTYFRSVIIFGKIRILEDENEIREAIEKLAIKYRPTDSIENRKQEIAREWKPLCMMELSVEYMTGKVGTGKSFFAGCIANALIDRDIPVLMTNIPSILNQLTGMFAEDRAAFISALDDYSLLILDDLGVERNTEYALEQMFLVIDSRYRSRKPLIVTTNLKLEEVKNPPDLAHARIYDRIMDRCAPVLFSGRNFREEKAAREIVSRNETRQQQQGQFLYIPWDCPGKEHHTMRSEKNIQNVAGTTAGAENPPALVKKIGRTTYIVRIHFSETSTETMSDKIKRMLKNEIQQMG